MKDFHSIVSNLQVMEQYQKKIAILTELKAIIHDWLPIELQKEVNILDLHVGTLVLGVYNSIWKHKLRFMKADLLSYLRQQPKWSFLSSIDIKTLSSLHNW